MNEIRVSHFRGRHYQKPLWDYMMSGGKRAVCVWHRRAGKDTTSLSLTIRKAFNRVGVYYHCFPEYSQGRKVLWDGIDGQGRPFLSAFPRDLIVAKNRQEMRVEFINGSMWQVIGADNYDAVVGANPVGIVFSEWAISDKYPHAWDYFRPMLAENGGWALFIYTPRGMNHGYTLYEMAKKNPEWFCERLTVEDTGAISKEDIQAERDAGMSDDMIAQEFYCNFTVVGARPFQFSHLHHVVDPLPIPKNAPIYMAMDWGFGAPFAVVWAWVDADNRLYQFSEWYGWNGKPNQGLRLEDSVIAQGIKDRERVMGIGDYSITRLAGPDCFQRKPNYQGGGQGPSTADVFAEHGLYLSPGDPSRELKLRQMRERLRVWDDQPPMLLIYKNCEQTTRTLPLLSTDLKRAEDVDTTGEDHIYDAMCHIIMARPLSMTQTPMRPMTDTEKDWYHITGIDYRLPEGQREHVRGPLAFVDDPFSDPFNIDREQESYEG